MQVLEQVNVNSSGVDLVVQLLQVHRVFAAQNVLAQILARELERLPRQLAVDRLREGLRGLEPPPLGEPVGAVGAVDGVAQNRHEPDARRVGHQPSNRGGRSHHPGRLPDSQRVRRRLGAEVLPYRHATAPFILIVVSEVCDLGPMQGGDAGRAKQMPQQGGGSRLLGSNDHHVEIEPVGGRRPAFGAAREAFNRRCGGTFGHVCHRAASIRRPCRAGDGSRADLEERGFSGIETRRTAAPWVG